MYSQARGKLSHLNTKFRRVSKANRFEENSMRRKINEEESRADSAWKQRRWIIDVLLFFPFLLIELLMNSFHRKIDVALSRTLTVFLMFTCYSIEFFLSLNFIRRQLIGFRRNFVVFQFTLIDSSEENWQIFLSSFTQCSFDE